MSCKGERMNCGCYAASNCLGTSMECYIEDIPCPKCAELRHEKEVLKDALYKSDKELNTSKPHLLSVWRRLN